MVYCYLNGLSWMNDYYLKGSEWVFQNGDTEYYYPYRYSPLVSDFLMYMDSYQSKQHIPWTWTMLHQMYTILPKRSLRLLPAELQEYKDRENITPIIQMEGCRHLHQAYVELPPIENLDWMDMIIPTYWTKRQTCQEEQKTVIHQIDKNMNKLQQFIRNRDREPAFTDSRFQGFYNKKTSKF